MAAGFSIVVLSRFSGALGVRAKRESGAPLGNAGAAPATVSGELMPITVTGANALGRPGSSGDP
jgi:hypothetical protein